MSEEEKRKELSRGSRQAAYCTLHSHVKDGVLERGVLKTTADMFSVHKSTMGRFWREINKKIADASLTPSDVLSDASFFESEKHNRGRKKKWDRAQLREAVKEVALSKRGSFRRLSGSVAVPKSTLHRMYKKEGLFRRHTSSLRPFLTEENKVARMAHALDEINPVLVPTRAGGTEQRCFKDFYDRVDIDEKWFFLSRENETYILIADDENEEWDDDNSGGEENPTRRVRNKNHITKVMFLCAQARPRWDSTKNQMWDGKIGIWPIGHFAPAQRRSARRAAGTMVWHDEKINKDKYRELLLEKVVPAIVEKWPRRDWNNNRFIIRMQQDGAKSHIHPTDEAFLAGLAALGVENKLLLYTQPANSPDTNINDLGFFCALQSMFHRLCPNDEQQIIEYVEETYNEYDYKKINYIWLTLMGCYNEIIRCHGDNNYKVPHLGKERLDRRGELPTVLPVIEEALDLL